MRHIWGSKNRSVCGELNPTAMTRVAMASDCNPCRAKLLIEPVVWSDPDPTTGERKPLNVRLLPDWEPEPHPGADKILAFVRERRES